jgi:hypothetical protein
MFKKQNIKDMTPEKLSAIMQMRNVYELFKPLIPKDFRIRVVCIWLIVMWAFLSIVTISLYKGA